MVPDKPQKVENFHFTWCGYIGIRTRYYVKGQILQNFVAFTEYMSFKIFSKTGFVLLWFCSNMCQYCKVCGVFEAEHDKSHVLHICRCVFLLSFFETVAIVQLQPCHFWIKSFDNAVVERIAFFEEFRRKCAFILSGSGPSIKDVGIFWAIFHTPSPMSEFQPWFT